MWYVVVISIILFMLSLFGNGNSVTRDGEYQSKVYILNKNATSLNIITKVQSDKFVTRSYLNTPAISGTAIFLSEGRFTHGDAVGKFKYVYTMSELERPNILDANNADFYIGMAGRVGLPLEDEVEVIYSNSRITILDMHRNSNVITFIKEH